MPLITTKTTTFINRENKYRMMVEYRSIFEEMIPAEKGELVMTDFFDEVFMLLGDGGSAPCAVVEVGMIQDVFADYGSNFLEAVLAWITDVVVKYTQIPEDRIFIFYRNSQLWMYQKKNVLPELMKWGMKHR